jgi:hypothetical protein
MIKELLNKLKRVFAPAPSVPSCVDKLTQEEWTEVVHYIAKHLNETAMQENPIDESTKEPTTASPHKAPQKRGSVGRLVTKLARYLRTHYVFRYNILTEQTSLDGAPKYLNFWNIQCFPIFL